MADIYIKSGNQITKQDVFDAIELDRKSYNEIYYVNIEQCLAWFDTNCDIYIMAFSKKTNSLVGYINFSPVTKEFYDDMCNGKIVDTSIKDTDVLPYVDNKEYYAYFSSIIVSQEHRRKGIARTMLEALSNFIVELADHRNIYFKGIVGDAISDGGRHLLTSYGLKILKTSSHNTTIMIGDFFDKDIMVTKYNKDIVAAYRRHKNEKQC